MFTYVVYFKQNHFNEHNYLLLLKECYISLLTGYNSKISFPHLYKGVGILFSGIFGTGNGSSVSP